MACVERGFSGSSKRVSMPAYVSITRRELHDFRRGSCVKPGRDIASAIEQGLRPKLTTRGIVAFVRFAAYKGWNTNDVLSGLVRAKVQNWRG
jgi:hypothetical protein